MPKGISRHPEITFQRMSAARKGKRFSEDHKKKIGEGNRGKQRPRW